MRKLTKDFIFEIVEIKSKYYPINDSEDDQVRIITTNKKKNYDIGELERFLESTAKTSVNTKVMREELETEMHNYSAHKENERNTANTLRTLENVETLIKNVSLPSFQNKIEKTATSAIKKNYLEDDTSISSSNIKETEKERTSIFAKKNTPEESSMASKIDTFSKLEETNSPKKKFEISNYKGMFENANEKIDEPKSVKSKETTPPRKIKIVYSSSSPSSKESSSSDEKSISIGKGKFSDNKKSFEEDDDEDFKW